MHERYRTDYGASGVTLACSENVTIAVGMSKMIQIRNVSDSLHRRLKSRGCGRTLFVRFPAEGSRAAGGTPDARSMGQALEDQDQGEIRRFACADSAGGAGDLISQAGGLCLEFLHF